MERRDDTGLPAETGQAADTGQDADTGQAGSTGQATGAELTNDTGLPDDAGQFNDTGQDDNVGISDDEEPLYEMDILRKLEMPDDMDLLNDMDPPDDTGQANSTGQAISTGLTENEILESVVDDAIDSLKPTDTPEKVAANVILTTEFLITNVNNNRPKGTKFNIPKKLFPFQIAKLMLAMFQIRLILCAGTNTDPECALLCMYAEYGPDAGTYAVNDNEIYKTALRFNVRLTKREFDEVVMRLRTLAKQVTRTMDPDLIAVNNGIFDYKAKKLLAFSPDYVFLTKSRVDYNPNPANVVIHNDTDGTDWDVESWVGSLSDDAEVVNLIWEILGAILRPHVPWDRSAWFYAEDGNNGKGTLCVLMRNLCGTNAVASITIKEFSERFALEPLVRAVAIINDENPVGTFIDAVDKLKAVITNDVISIDRKHKPIISFQYHGFMVQCLNEFPRFKDKSDSFCRRQLFVPFPKCFTGMTRKYIKNDYLSRKEVLEYVLHRVLHMDYYELSNPIACQQVLQEYKEYNDPVRQFFQEMEFSFTWSLLPFQFLYDLYKAWFTRNNPKGSIQGRNTFIKELERVTKTSRIWEYHKTRDTIRTGNRMDAPEPMIVLYDLDFWKNPTYIGSNADIVAKTKAKDVYHGGLVRLRNAFPPINSDNSTENIST